ncbi:sugar/nucleoside kinase (ribokinase family) [Fontibacillus phaseoli]|uniref:Sugar/nucleoside kinase (Ribokinase family) n=1 Tax=Fontibacillus phaseoli TaxID=1416533 RepID=A0A369B9A8_9BACL|nr:PfkB family carbohydrate kinase [Fontibacillus phaseoli]RCX18112.1 sugar/nucleoside kinase (ribokinase family) [Fontibacillus phaseoli]
MKVIGFGDNVVDQYQHTGVMYPGGNAVNFAVYAQKLGVNSAYLGVFGRDEAADLIKASLLKERIDISQCIDRNGVSGYCQVNLVDGDRVFVDWNEGGISTEQPIEVEQAQFDYLQDFRLIHSSCFSRLENELPKLRGLDALVSFDFSDEPQFHDDAYLAKVCPYIDFALLSCSELTTSQIEQMLKRVTGFGAGAALITRGSKGSLFYDGVRFYEGKVDYVVPVDTMGAGDAFVTAFLIHLLDSGWRKGHFPGEGTVIEGLRKAAAFSAQICLVEGSFGYGKAYV